MISRFTIALSMAAVAGMLLAPSTPAQRRVVYGTGESPRSQPPFRLGGGEEFEHRSEHGSEQRLLNTSALLFASPFYAPAEFEQDAEAPSGQPVQIAAAQPVPPPAPAPSPVEPLLMEKRNGEWVRVATGNHMVASQSTVSDSAKPAGSHSGIVEPAKGTSRAAALPPAVIVFRDGHQEELLKYVIQGEVLYTNTVTANGLSRERTIPLSQLDLPASLKLNKDRGAKFGLPSAPNEVVVRF